MRPDMMLLAIFLTLTPFLSQAQAAGGERFSIGYGVSKLKTHHLKNKHDRAGSAASSSCENVTEHYFPDAVINNFAPIESQLKWYGKGQRYWLNKQFWGGNGFPIFVFIGGEGEESCNRLTNHMYLFDLAEKHNALLMNVEHRFYGESYPTPNMTTDYLKVLSADQALADLARIIGAVKSDLNTENSQVITVGGSYPGNLAAWFRLKYPSVTLGSIASSAPVTAKANFFEYMEVVGQSIVYFGGQTCYDNIKTAASAIEQMYQHGVGSSGMTNLEKEFQTCTPIGSGLDLGVFLSDLMGNIQGTVQYNNEHDGTMNVTNICEIMTDGEDAYYQFVKLQALYREANGQTCEDASWKEMVAYLANGARDPTNAARPWTYQTCNEFGYYQTTDSENQPFHWSVLNLDFSQAICKAAFDGWDSLPQTEWINQEYGDVRIASTNTAFPSGTIDPWHALGVTNSTADQLQMKSDQQVFILGTAHCNDLYAPASSDPDSLVFAREEIAGLVTKWLE